MTTYAYNPIYLSKAARAVGTMLHDAVYEFQYDGEQFFRLFIQSGVAKQIENGNPKFIAGKSGLELFCDVVEYTSGKNIEVDIIETYDRSDAFWTGYILTYYQCYSGKCFRDILETLPYNDLLKLYDTLHEADIQKSYEVFDSYFINSGSKLKAMRKRVGITQEELAEASDVPVSTIRAYERKAKDLSKAQLDIVVRLAKALSCEIGDIVG